MALAVFCSFVADRRNRASPIPALRDRMPGFRPVVVLTALLAAPPALAQMSNSGNGIGEVSTDPRVSPGKNRVDPVRPSRLPGADGVPVTGKQRFATVRITGVRYTDSAHKDLTLTPAFYRTLTFPPRRSPLPGLRRAVAFDAARCRIRRASSGAPPGRLTRAHNGLPPTSRVRSLARSPPMRLQRLLCNLSFALRSNGRAHGRGRLTAWSCGGFRRLADGGGARVKGNYRPRMVRVHPYPAWTVSRGVQVRGAPGLGRGTLRTADDPGGAPRSRDATPSSGTGGVSARLFQREPSTVKLEGEAGLARFRVAGAAPSGVIGLRHDGGDGASGAGIEPGVGLRLAEPVAGWSVDGFGHRPMTRGGALPRGWGFGASFTLDRDPSARGPSLRLTQSWGRTGSDRLREDGNAGGPPEPAPGPRLEVELGYGFGAFGRRGTVTPFGALSLGGEPGQGYRAGVRIYSGPAASLSLEVERREPRHSAPEHAAMLRGRLRF